MLYRGMDRATLDAAYNNTAAVGIARRDEYVAAQGVSQLAGDARSLTFAYGNPRYAPLAERAMLGSSFPPGRGELLVSCDLEDLQAPHRGIRSGRRLAVLAVARGAPKTWR